MIDALLETFTSLFITSSQKHIKNLLFLPWWPEVTHSVIYIYIFFLSHGYGYIISRSTFGQKFFLPLNLYNTRTHIVARMECNSFITTQYSIWKQLVFFKRNGGYFLTAHSFKFVFANFIWMCFCKTVLQNTNMISV